MAGLDSRFVDLAPDLLAGVTPNGCATAMQALLAPKPAARLLLDHVAPVRISVHDAVRRARRGAAPRSGRISFTELTAHLTERLEVIVRFLALLELYKQGLVELEQAVLVRRAARVMAGRADAGPVAVEEYQG